MPPKFVLSKEQQDEVNARRVWRRQHMTYDQAAHAMQSGVAIEMSRTPDPTSGKHLRVGINSAMVTDLAFVRLLMAKGIFTEEEYYEALRIAMIDEATRYEDMLTPLFGSPVTLL